MGKIKKSSHDNLADRIAFLVSFALLAVLAVFQAGPVYGQADMTEVTNSMADYFGTLTGKDLIIGTKIKESSSSFPTTPESFYYSAQSNAALTETSSFNRIRIGSQSKMFTAAVILALMDTSHDFSLETTINELLEIQAVKDALPANAQERIGHYAVKDLLNMGTDVPNYLAVPSDPDHPDVPFVYYWLASQANGATGGYGSVEGYDDDATVYKKLAELALIGQPIPPLTPPYNSEYSNSNAVILALIAQALTGEDFGHLLDEYLKSESITSTILQSSVGDTGGNEHMVGTDGGPRIVNLDPRLAWTSGAVITTMPDLLNSLNKFVSDSRRTEDQYTTLMSMHGMPTHYGLGLMTLDFQDFEAGPVLATGHGGAIPGSTSFSAWLRTHDPNQTLNTLLGVYLNGSTILTSGGILASQGSESMFVSMVEHLYRQYRAEEYGIAPNVNGSDYTLIYNGDPSGYSSGNSAAAAIAASNLSFELTGTLAGKSAVPSIAYLDTDTVSPGYFGPGGLINGITSVTLDPVYTFYGKNDFVAAGHVSVALTVAGALSMPSWARIESYANGQTAGRRFNLLSLPAGSTGDINGQVAAYGSNVLAVRAGRNLTVGESGVIEAHGNKAAALELSAGNGNIVNGRITAVGSGVVGLEVSPGAGVTVGSKALIRADSYALSAKEDNNKFVYLASNEENAATAARVLSGGSLTADGGTIMARADYPTPDGIVHDPGGTIDLNDPASSLKAGVLVTGLESNGGATALKNRAQISSYGQAVSFVGGTNDFQAEDSLIQGSVYSFHIKSSLASNDSVHLNLENSVVLGKIYSEAQAGSVSVEADARTVILGSSLDQPVIESSGRPIDLQFSPGTTIGWDTPEIPEIGEEVTVISGAASSSVLDGVRVALGPQGVLDFTLRTNGGGQLALQVSGLSGTYGRNALEIYEAFRQRTAGRSSDVRQLAWDALQDANNLAPEGTVGQYYAGLAMFQQLTYKANQAIKNKLQSSFGASDRTPAAGSESGAEGNWLIAVSYGHFDLDRKSVRAYSGYEVNGDAVTLGIGRLLIPGVSLSAYLALGQSETEFDHLRFDMDSDLFMAGANLGFHHAISPDLSWNLYGGLSIGRTDNDYRRRVGIAFPQGYSGSFQQDYFGLNAEFNLIKKISPQTSFIPKISVSYIRAEQDGLRESGGQITALTTDSFKTDTIKTLVGAALAHDFEVSDQKILTLSGEVGWEHTGGDRNPTVRGYFTNFPVTTFVTRSSENPQNALNLGLSMELSNRSNLGMSLNLEADFQVAEKETSQQYALTFKYVF
ncbi:MAG: autotransporter domain-containing protein [Deltaproteobacteria bacterium]|jgi:CubicO group peptidase (beta-lactamase class C family)|nr:autotransporter domain-containing protein [Deltaproteobacteria bacterium]